MQAAGKTVLVTGGAGFVGSHLCEHYLNEGCRVICVDNLQTTQTKANIEHLFAHDRFRFIEHDIVEPLAVRERIDWIFNFACSGAPAIYQYDPIHTLRTNVDGMRNMLELARMHGARIMQASTSEVYGDPEVDPQPEHYRGNVSPTGPRACYDEGKRAAETLCMDYQREHGVDVKIVRIFNTYGPRMDLNDGRVISNFVGNALDDRDLVIYGDGSATRSFQYIDDLVAGVDAMMRTDNFVGPVNFGNETETTTVAELAQRIVDVTGSKASIVYREKATDDPMRRRPDITVAREQLRWQPRIGLTEGLEKTIAHVASLERPDRRVLVFATTYYPDMGPAEQALAELSRSLPNTAFHIVTARRRRGLASTEVFGSDLIHRIGFGTRFDKFLLPVWGMLRARRLHRTHGYYFVWSIMASYGGLAAALFKLVTPRASFLVSLDRAELSSDRPPGALKRALYRWVFRSADLVYSADPAQEDLVQTINRDTAVTVASDDTAQHMRDVRDRYTQLLNEKRGKLDRPK
jgi:UDP-glucuronate decarboxylase